MLSVRQVLIGLALAFTAYLGARGLWWTPSQVIHPLMLIGVLLLYLLTTWLCLFVEPGFFARRLRGAADTDRRGGILPGWAAGLALVTTLVVPTTIALAVEEPYRTEAYATWYIGGIGALMTIVMVRRRPWTAWTGTAILAVSSTIWMSPLPEISVIPALSLGLVGSIMWVTAAQLTVVALDRAAKDTAHLADLQQAASAWQASQAGRQRERRVRVQGALEVAGPVLARVVLSGGDLTDADRVEARLAEGRLRDELRDRVCWTTTCGQRWRRPDGRAPPSPCSTRAVWTDWTPHPLRSSVPSWPRPCAAPIRAACTSAPRRTIASR